MFEVVLYNAILLYSSVTLTYIDFCYFSGDVGYS